ncbi:hypothetical protein ABE10_00760, partial [Bacillus toyonensis]|nr:hypothetical protein [Bacillus toyonensis]
RLHREPGEQRREGDAQLRRGEVGRGDPQGRDRHREAGLAALASRFQFGPIEVDQCELARDEQTGPYGEQKPHAQPDVVHHDSASAKAEGGSWGEGLQEGGSSMVRRF